MSRAWLARGGVLLALLLAGWSAGSALHGRRFEPWSQRSRRIRVLTTIFPLYDFARTIGGPDVEVRNLLPPGVDPHEFALSPRDAELVAGADVILANGAGLDDFILDAARKAGVGSEKIVRLAHSSWSGPLRPAFVTENGQPDPHQWLSPVLARDYVEGITGVLRAAAQLDITSGNAYELISARGKAFESELVKLHADYKSALAAMRHRPFITFHSAYTHLADDYGLRVAGVWEKTPGREPSPREVGALLRIAREEHVLAIFAEPQFSARALEMIAADAHLPVYTLDPLETAEDFDHTHYIPVMRRNLEVLVRALR